MDIQSADTKSRPVRVLLVAPCFGDYGGIEAFTLAVADTLMKDERFEVRVCFKRTANFVLRQGLAQQCHAYPVEFCSRAGRSLLAAIAWADVRARPERLVATVAFPAPASRADHDVLSLHNTLPSRPIAQRIGWRDVRPHQPASAGTTLILSGKRGSRTRQARPVPVYRSTSRLSMADVMPDARRGFVFLGRFVPGKGADVLLEAYRQARLNPAVWPLTFVGDGPLGRALKDRSAIERIDGVRFAGFIDGEMKARDARRSEMVGLYLRIGRNPSGSSPARLAGSAFPASSHVMAGCRKPPGAMRLCVNPAMSMA